MPRFSENPDDQRKNMVNIGALNNHPNETAFHEDWIEDFMTALYQDTTSLYVNFMAAEGAAHVRE